MMNGRHMMNGQNMMNRFSNDICNPVFMGRGILIIILLLIVALYFFRNHHRPDLKRGSNETPSSDNAMRILNERLAKGEITTEEYENIKNTLMK